MNDLEFVQRCCRGENQAWDEFVEKYSRLIYSYINCVLKQKVPGLFSQENISDIFQDIFLSLTKDNFKKLRSFKSKNGCSLASWLRQVTINYSIDYARKFKPAISLDEETGDELTIKELIADNTLTVQTKLNIEEKLAQLGKCVEGLDTDDRLFLEFHINKGLTLEDLRLVFKVSRGTIDMRKSRIIGRLRECFKNKGFSLD